jgi:hypothetical protein
MFGVVPHIGDAHREGIYDTQGLYNPTIFYIETVKQG